jgi:hypothetical protein
VFTLQGKGFHGNSIEIAKEKLALSPMPIILLDKEEIKRPAKV